MHASDRGAPAERVVRVSKTSYVSELSAVQTTRRAVLAMCAVMMWTKMDFVMKMTFTATSMVIL